MTTGGAWLYRCCGCALGKPFEAFRMSAARTASRAGCLCWFEEAGKLPISFYAPKNTGARKVRHRGRMSQLPCRKHQHHVLGRRHLLYGHRAADDRPMAPTYRWTWVKCGTANFRSTRSAQPSMWHTKLRQHQGLRRQAYVLSTHAHHNPYREWIAPKSASICYGAAAGNPMLAADGACGRVFRM